LGHRPCRALSEAKKAVSHDLLQDSGDQAWLAAADQVLRRIARYAPGYLGPGLGENLIAFLAGLEQGQRAAR
jgi:hypothetical protein